MQIDSIACLYGSAHDLLWPSIIGHGNACLSVNEVKSKGTCRGVW